LHGSSKIYKRYGFCGVSIKEIPKWGRNAVVLATIICYIFAPND
jgi:hypothetical protein